MKKQKPMEEEMKKSLLISVIMILFLLSVVMLEAVPFLIVVHVVTCGPASGGHQITGSEPIYCSWTTNTYPMTLSGNLGSTFSCWGTSNFGSDYSSGQLNPYNVNHFYLDLTGIEEIPDPPSSNY